MLGKSQGLDFSGYASAISRKSSVLGCVTVRKGKGMRRARDGWPRTKLARTIEDELEINLPTYLRQKKRAGWSDTRIANTIGIGPSTVRRYIRQIGFSLYQRAELASSLDIPKDSDVESLRTMGAG